MWAFLTEEKGALARAGCRKGNSTFYIPADGPDSQTIKPSGASAERHSFLQYALLHFRDDHPPNCEPTTSAKTLGANSMRGTIKILDYLTGGRRKSRTGLQDWTWKELTDKVKYSPFPIVTSLLKFDSDYLNRLAVDSFTAIMRFMGDLPLGLHQKEVECVYTILVICHHHPQLRDELYCQIMKQTTNNKSLNLESGIRGWRLLAFLAAFFKCSTSLMPYLMKYLETAAQDLRRIEHATADVCMKNLKQTTTYGGRRNVPTETEVNAIIEGKFNRMQDYFLPGGVQLNIPTSSSTVVEDIILTVGRKMGIKNETEFLEFSLYCIVEGDQYTMPLERDEYILDLVAELERNGSTYYLVFCRSVWCFPSRLDSELYIEIIFHQIIPDYLEGYLLIKPSNCSTFSPGTWDMLLKIATLMHKAKGMNSLPNKSDMMYLLPKPAMNFYTEITKNWAETLLNEWQHTVPLNAMEAKAQCIEILQKWSLFGSCFFGAKMLDVNSDLEEEFIIAVNKTGINVLHIQTHETLWRFNFAAANAPDNVVSINGTKYADVVFGDTNVKKTLRLQVDHAHEVLRLITQYELIQKEQKEKEDVQLSYPRVMIKV
ncbi:unconventional myosin-XV-like [Uloborus diversus]|uniref:unconventional myosin-XV-like n=1 Tax=Uloborus diversus TaxID=327109 RepID=UPI002409A944|nr:unconventional myosin-XV-like [Uloborus diversus]